jgi:superfamily II DNA or RNA helicase
MSFIKTWSPHFKSSVRMRGRSIQAAGRVSRATPASDELVCAHVQGSEQYTVTIADEGVQCTCSHFIGGAYCKHIWATLLDLKYNPQPGDGDQLLDHLQPRPPKARKRTGKREPNRRGEPAWVGRLSLLRTAGFDTEADPPSAIARPRQVCYLINPELSMRHGGLVVEMRHREPTSTGWSALRRLKINPQSVVTLPDPVDRELCALILGATWVNDSETGERYSDDRARAAFRIQVGAQHAMLRRMIDTGRCFIDSDQGPNLPLVFDGGGDAWVLWMVGEVSGDELRATVELRRGEQRMTINTPQLILGGSDGLVVYDGRVAWFDDGDAFRWVTQFRDDMRIHRERTPITVPLTEVDAFLERLYALPQIPEIDLPESVARVPAPVRPTPHIEIFSPASGDSESRGKLTAKIGFDYRGMRVAPGQTGRFITAPVGEDDQPSVAMRRDERFEQRALNTLAPLGFRSHPSGAADMLLLTRKQLPVAAATLLAEGWVVQADRKSIRHPGPSRMSVASGIDWFELRGTVRYETEAGGFDVDLPAILAAARAGRNMIDLGDGSQGLLPEQWLAEHGLLTAIGKLQGDHLRFKSSQAALLDALLDEQEIETVDEKFAEARLKLRQFAGIKAIPPAPTFQGTLRPYQQEALGWFEFLRWFGIGGILADDMGLGKTVQVLAMLDARYDGEGGHDAKTHKPTLIVAPRSVVFNWIDEAQRFAPKLRVQAYTGTDRDQLRAAFTDHDVIVTSYGLLRRDIEELVEHEFDYAVLDEAQAIKNPNSQSAKSARLLKADHRLALTGTPVENHLGDLWSIFEFLNPGILGNNTRFGQLVRNTSGSTRISLDSTNHDGAVQRSAEVSFQIASSLRPFILRRTKAQVLDDLPDKTEQTIVCEMEETQRRTYDELREHYRGTLLKQVSTRSGGSILGGNGSGGGAMMVLEALLRLRQAACHPGLIDKSRSDEPSAKLEALLESLTELVDEGHKALVFSQFTSMLSLVQDRLTKLNIPFAYLDGRTRNRREVVERFQSDADCPVFLISLKAGGLGLNLTAAEYVFILDPWWNPAVEQQAIDRTHRIGQTRHVFAYRMICQDTIEQRIAELQDRKRKLAEAIVDGQKSLLKSLTREDLEVLLS